MLARSTCSEDDLYVRSSFPHSDHRRYRLGGNEQRGTGRLTIYYVTQGRKKKKKQNGNVKSGQGRTNKRRGTYVEEE